MKVRDLTLEFFNSKLPKLNNLITIVWKFEPIQDEDSKKDGRKLSLNSTKIKIAPNLPDMSLKEISNK
jgi:hypothetical protein